MYLLKNTLRATLKAQRLHTIFQRNIRITSSSDADAESRPPEGHVLEQKDRFKNSLDPQAQSAHDSSHAPRGERPAYVHAESSKDYRMGGDTTGAKEEAAAPSLWLRLKQMLGLGSKSSQYGGGNRQS